MPKTPQLLTTAQVAERKGVDVRTVHRDVEAGRLVAKHRGPGVRGALLFEAREVERYLAAAKAPAA